MNERLAAKGVTGLFPRPAAAIATVLLAAAGLAGLADPALAQEGPQGSAGEERPAGKGGVLDPVKHSLARLASPGELAGPHRELDAPDKCGRCHTGTRGLDRDLCLSCHEKVRARLEAGRGYHGTLDGPCWECHSDHRGREHEMVSLDDDAFDHRRAAYDLLGAHRRLACKKCHDARAAGARTYQRRYYLGLPDDCAGCHRTPHGEHYRQPCTTCHDERAWDACSRRFDHGGTRFPLLGLHRAAACDGCHDKEKPAPAAGARCADCHRGPHGGQYGQECRTCHEPGGWRAVTAGVDHQATRFPLTGAHRGAACSDCHKREVTLKPGTACRSCHEDEHRGRFGPDCEHCHTTGGWKGRWLAADHERTRLPLRGAHLALDCVKCHTLEGGDGRLDPACRSCHENPHVTPVEQGCTACHDEESWRSKWPGALDHQATRFPLDATHTGFDCAVCHEHRTLAVKGLLCTECHEEVASFYEGTYLAGLLADARPDVMHGKVACRGCHAETDRGADLQAILHRCETCHPPEYGDYALAWMSVAHREGRATLARLGTREDTAADARRYLINRITALAPHNFIRAAELLRALQAEPER